MKLATILNETYVNAVKTADKQKYVDQVWEILQQSYKQIGGIHGSGFESPEDMIAKIPFWKMVKRGDKIVCVQMYKDSNGRKAVAMGTDGTKEGKAELAKILGDDFTRSYVEVSDAAEKFIKKNFPDLFDKFKIPAEEAGHVLGKFVVPSKDGFHYTRKIGTESHEKILIGTPGKKLVFYEF